jgi:hypothetical protein
MTAPQTGCHCLAARPSSAQFLTIGLGVIMGVGWAVMLGDTLEAATPGGATFGLKLCGPFLHCTRRRRRRILGGP